MRDFSKIKCTLWGSKKFNKLTEKSKLFYLYIHTNTRVNSCGCYFSPIGYMMHDLGWNQKDVENCLAECVKADLIDYNFDEDTVYIKKFFSVNAPTNPKHAIKLFSDIDAIPYLKFKQACALELKRFIENSGWKIEKDFLKRIDTLSIGYTPLDLDGDGDGDGDGDNTPLPPTRGNDVDQTKKIGIEKEFEEFWEGYKPYEMHKGAKKAAREKYKSARKDVDHATIIRKRDEYINYCHGQRVKTRHASTWLSQEGWNDDYPKPNPKLSPDNRKSQDDQFRGRVNDTAGFVDDLCGYERDYSPPSGQ